MALSDHSASKLKWSLLEQSGHWAEHALDGSVANDPCATSAVHCRNDFDDCFSPYRSNRLSR
jgi:hypothetical protein